GRVTVWRRLPDSGELIREGDRFRPWLLLDRLDDLLHLGDALGRTEAADVLITYRELDGPGALRYLVSSDNYRTLNAAVLAGATQRLGRRVGHLKELGADAALALLPEEQYLVATGRSYFRDLSFDELRRLQFDLETTGLHAEVDKIFMIAVRHPSGNTEVLEASGPGDAAEADLIRRLIATIQAADPDVIENHNLHGFDLPFLHRRARRLGDAGPATGVIDPLLVRAYLRAGTALPAHEESDGTPHSGAALHLFATGVARRVVKADVASLYPSLMRTYRIGPARDHLGALL